MTKILELVRILVSLMRDAGFLVFGALRVREFFYPDVIQPNRQYSTTKAARFFGVKRIDVVRMIVQGDLPAMKVNDYYRIMGIDIMKALGHDPKSLQDAGLADVNRT
ncbi:MAG: helix-turn-helix domain-containing protein [Alphaproteobacteria bacterium]|nr:helix-turn-helix domain-containing protein [Alphaproteobacteria bacterium]